MGKPQEQMPQVPQLDPAIQPLADQNLKAAQDFSAQSGSVKKQQGDIAKQSSNLNLADTNRSITKGASSRGLLYSGLQQGAKAQAGGKAASDLSSQQAGINQAVDQQSGALQNNALQAQMGVENLKNQRNALAYNIAQQSN